MRIVNLTGKFNLEDIGPPWIFKRIPGAIGLQIENRVKVMYKCYAWKWVPELLKEEVK